MTICRTAAALLAASLVAADLAAADTLPPGPHDCVVRPRDMIELTSEEEGVITEITVDRGHRVSRGQVVARLDSRLQQSALELARIRAGDKAAVDAGRARLAYRRDELDRMEELSAKNVASRSALDEAAVELRLAELELESAEIQLRAAEAEHAQAEIRLARRAIRSPADGVVLRVTASLGEFAHEQAPVMTIAVLDPLHVETFLPVALFPAIREGQDAEVQITAPFDVVRTARVAAVDAVFDAASNTFGVRLELPNPGHRIPSGIKCAVSFVPPGG